MKTIFFQPDPTSRRRISIVSANSWRPLDGLQALVLCGALLGASLAPGANLVPNGSFDAEGDPLSGWHTTYQRKGESWYQDNHKYLEVVDDGGRRKVLKMTVPKSATAQGVKVDSYAFAVDPNKNYRFSVMSRSTGPQARIMIEGYYWHPRARPSGPDDVPVKREDMRMAYRYPMIYFRKGATGGIASVPRSWTKGSVLLYGRSDKRSGLSDLALRHMAKVQFMVVHIVAIGGTGELYIDDVTVEAEP